MTEAALANAEFTAFCNNVLVEKFERLRNILLDGLSYHSGLPLGKLQIAQGAKALEVGAGWRDTALRLAQMVGPTGYVLGVDCGEALPEKGSSWTITACRAT